jgi:uncharacterized membrane protein YoaT (DUF817 family)
MSNLMINGSTKPQIFFVVFHFFRIEQPDEKKCINHIILFGIFALANNLGNFLRRLAFPKKIKDWSLRSSKKHASTVFLSLSVWILAELAIKFVKKTLDYYYPGKILILLQYWKAFLRSQAFNMGNIGL